MLLSPQDEPRYDLADLVTRCARANGLADYVERIEEPTVTVFDPAPGLEGRAWVEAVGTGRIAIQRMRLEDRAQEPADEIPTDAERLSDVELKILESGPIVDPDTGESIDIGCRPWGYREASSAASEPSELASDYEAWIEERYESSAEYVDIERRQFECVASSGYPDIRQLEDANAIVADALEDWLNGVLTYEEALSVDIEIGLMYYDCYASVEADFDALADEVAYEFMVEHGLVDES